jgi:hypothetical protein
MNKPQKYLTVVCLILFVGTLVLAPWQTKVAYHSDGFLFYNPTVTYYPAFVRPNADGPSKMGQPILYWQPLICEWVALGVIYTGLFFLFRKTK